MIVIFVFMFLHSIVVAQDCQVCENLIEKFHNELEKSEKSNFGGGNTAWEERKLGNYATSETRLVHIVEKLCPAEIDNREKCQYLREEIEEKLEQWWFDEFRKDQSAAHSLHRYLCVDHLRLCCPGNRWGAQCELCAHYNETTALLCSGHGRCDGDGTRAGNGTCVCHRGYEGDACDRCAEDHWRSSPESSESVSCSPCHESCAGCRGDGPGHCTQCGLGWTIDSERNQCVDIDECAAGDACQSSDRFCVNTNGSFECRQCDEACADCTGAGADKCVSCRPGFQRANDSCVDINECSADSELCREPGQRCTNLPGSFSCQCQSNYSQRPDGSCSLIESKKPSSPSSSSSSSSSDKIKPDKINNKSKPNRKPPKKIWTRKFEREFFKLICCVVLLGLVSYFFGYYSLIVLIAGVLCGYYVYYKSIKLDQIFSRNV